MYPTQLKMTKTSFLIQIDHALPCNQSYKQASHRMLAQLITCRCRILAQTFNSSSKQYLARLQAEINYNITEATDNLDRARLDH